MSAATPGRGINWNDTNESISRAHSLTLQQVAILRREHERKENPNALHRWVGRIFSRSTPQDKHRNPTELLRKPATPALPPKPPTPAVAASQKRMNPAEQTPAPTTIAVPLNASAGEATQPAALPADQPKPIARKNMNIPWGSITAEQWKTLTNRQLADTLGTSLSNVHSYRHRNNPPQGPRVRRTYDWDGITLEQWETLGNTQIARLLGGNKQTVRRYRTRNNLPNNPAGLPKQNPSPATPNTPKRYDWASLTMEQWETLSDAEIAKLMRGSKQNVSHYRLRNNLPNNPAPPNTPAPASPKRYDWESITMEQWATLNNSEIAELLGGMRQSVRSHRILNNLPPSPIVAPLKGGPVNWSAVTAEQWGTLTNNQIAELLDADSSTVRRYRKKKQLPKAPPRYSPYNWSGLTLEQWGNHTNLEIAEFLGAPVQTVANRRIRESLPSSPRRSSQNPRTLVTTSQAAAAQALTETDIKFMIHAHTQHNASIESLASIFGVTTTTISEHLQTIE